MCENCVFFLPVNILTGGTPASWAARHTTVCLDDRICKKVPFPHTLHANKQNDVTLDSLYRLTCS